ncbi:hypothetical protein M153_15100016787 [Pseudoloma neurophilia]|uniref:Uncharacterized protein n=1 Tax=Pseudoloma neurophilia TaxID=146866 RepID=A0A0R0M6S1_9MICR|nr:hypothetical protein M153_15100016787 [Pseudoloma neurophilia]
MKGQLFLISQILYFKNNYNPENIRIIKRHHKRIEHQQVQINSLEKKEFALS